MTKTDSEIIELLETCGEIANCKKCSFYNAEKNNCLIKLNTYALDLINRQQIYIERLQEYYRKYNNLKEEAEELHIEVEYAREKISLMEEFIITAKSEAVREFAEKLKERAFEFPIAITFGFGTELVKEAVSVIEIDNLVKEMMEGENG